MLYDNDDEHKSSNAYSEENLHCKHPVFQYNTHHVLLYAMRTLLLLLTQSKSDR